MKYYSLADLIKSSAMQICYVKSNKIIKNVTENMIAGTKVQIDNSGLYKEMACSFIKDDICISYCIDEIIFNVNDCSFVEHKYVKDINTVEDWYLNKSLLQCAVYNAIAIVNPNKKYITADFLIKKGFPCNELDISIPINSYLKFGDRIYEVKVLDADKLVDFYFDKSTKCTDYTSAKIFDVQYKHKEYELLNKYFTFNKLDNHEV
jgi:hypothetical protein